MSTELRWKDPQRTVLAFDSGEDMSDYNYRPVVLFDSNTIKKSTGTANTAPACIGIQERPAYSGTGVPIAVCCYGATKAISGAAFTAGAVLQADTNVAALVPADGGIAIGYALESAGYASQVVDVFINHSGQIIR